jgi:hypothetical protein
VIRLNDRDRYLAALRQADAGETLPLVAFIAERLIAVMELYLRGAKGEELQEPDDIDKRIALLKQELSNVSEPTVFSEAVYQALLNGMVRPLLERVGAKLSKFNELFVASQMDVMVGGGQGRRTGTSSIQPTVSAQVMDILGQKGVTSVHLTYKWKTFKKGGVKIFDAQVSITIQFSQLTFEVTAGKALKKLYGSSLNEDETVTIVTQMAEAVLEQIEVHLKGPKAKRRSLLR